MHGVGTDLDIYQSAEIFPRGYMTMRNMMMVVTVATLFALAGGEAFAQCGMGQGKRKICMNDCQMQMRQQMRDGS
jgi:hypothetical protein